MIGQKMWCHLAGKIQRVYQPSWGVWLADTNGQSAVIYLQQMHGRIACLRVTSCKILNPEILPLLMDHSIILASEVSFRGLHGKPIVSHYLCVVWLISWLFWVYLDP